MPKPLEDLSGVGFHPLCPLPVISEACHFVAQRSGGLLTHNVLWEASVSTQLFSQKDPSMHCKLLPTTWSIAITLATPEMHPSLAWDTTTFNSQQQQYRPAGERKSGLHPIEISRGNVYGAQHNYPPACKPLERMLLWLP